MGCGVRTDEGEDGGEDSDEAGKGGVSPAAAVGEGEEDGVGGLEARALDPEGDEDGEEAGGVKD